MFEFLPQVFWEGLNMGMIIAMVGLGISLIWGVMNVVNFAQGEFLMISMFLSFFFTQYTGLDPLLSLPLVAFFMYFFGVFVYKVFMRRVLKASMLGQLLLTYSLSLLLINLALILFTGRFKAVTNQVFTQNYTIGSTVISMTKVIPLIIYLISSIVLYIILNKTQIGRAIKATAINRTAASLVGVDPEKAYSQCVGISSAVAGIAGVAFSYYYYVYPGVASLFKTFGFVACCLGGMGSIHGAVIGGIIIGLIDSFVGTFFNVSLKYLAIFVLYILIVSYKPKGLFRWEI